MYACSYHTHISQNYKTKPIIKSIFKKINLKPTEKNSFGIIKPKNRDIFSETVVTWSCRTDF